MGSIQEDTMPTTLNPTCPLCGLRYTDRPLLDLHIREDHRRRDDRPEPDPGASGDTRTSPPRARGQFLLHSLPAELFPATRNVTTAPAATRNVTAAPAATRNVTTAPAARREVTAAPAARQPRGPRLGWIRTALHRVVWALRYVDREMMRAFEALARERRVTGHGSNGAAGGGRA
jgi:hypothetical protein